MSETTSEGGKLEATEVAREIDVLLAHLQWRKADAREDVMTTDNPNDISEASGMELAFIEAIEAVEALKEKLCESA